MLDINDKKLKWLKDAKFGLFIHWGLYAATEGWYGGKETAGIGEWIAAKETIPNGEYEKLAEKMTCEKFDPKMWAKLAKSAGMKYCVFTSKHHEGFSMFDTSYDDYSITKRSPYKKDVAKEIVDAMREEGIMPCFYYSHALDFHESEAWGNTWDNQLPQEERDFKSYINGKCKHQLTELLTNYGKIGMIWMDVPRGMTEEIALDLIDHVKSIQPDCLISGRIMFDPKYGDFGCMGDNQIPTAKKVGLWETAATMNDTWGYKRDDHNFKSPKELIELLCGLVSKGANLLLNIGPKANGEIPHESIFILNEFAKWFDVNGEAIEAVDASPFECDFSFGDVSAKDNNLYLYLYEKTEKVEIYGILNKVKNVSVLGGGNVKFSQDSLFTLDLSDVDFGEYVTVLKVELDGKPDILNGVTQQEKNIINLSAGVCSVIKNVKSISAKSLEGDAAVEAENVNLMPWDDMWINEAGIIENWTSEENYITWEADVIEEGEYEVCLYTIAQKYMPWTGGHIVRLVCGENNVSATLSDDRKSKGANYKYFAETGSILGKMHLKKGKNTLILYCDKINENDPVGLGVSKIIFRKI